MKAADALPDAIARLRAAGVPDPVRDARLLLAFAAGWPTDRISLHLQDRLDARDLARFERAITARAARQPLSQITGQRLFFGRRFGVSPDVLDPRPETETLVLAALAHPFRRVLDLGTGSGAIVLSLLAERPDAVAVAVDVSAEALQIARQNALALGVQDRVEFLQSDWFSALPHDLMFDLIVSNPPYIAADEMAGLSPEVRLWEPLMALSPGGDGLGPYRVIAAQAPQFLTPRGRLLAEIGPSQAAAVSGFWQGGGFQQVGVVQDLDGRDRVVTGTLG
ncbi:MAG: peptide chain release factor N(5)-glutamine methyltransferase [Paracoccaceae bacterium]|nr:peptide chain release factor N(5)-glutamine methyltransferase [Paracoccaceae bacterium]